MSVDFALLERLVAAVALIGTLLSGLRSIGQRTLFRGLRVPAGRAGRLVTVVETTHLPNATTLQVVKIGELYAVVGTSVHGLVKIADVPEASVQAWLAARRPSLA